MDARGGRGFFIPARSEGHDFLYSFLSVESVAVTGGI